MRGAALHALLTRASSQPRRAVLPAACSGTKSDCMAASSVEATLMCDRDLIYFSPSLGIFTHYCQETIYSDCFKDIVNICCCTHIKQEAVVLEQKSDCCRCWLRSCAVVLLGPSVLALSCYLYFSSSRDFLLGGAAFMSWQVLLGSLLLVLTSWDVISNPRSQTELTGRGRCDTGWV